VPKNDCFAHRQAEAATGCRATVQALERFKNHVMMLARNTLAIVSYCEPPSALERLPPDLDDWRPARFMILDGIGDEVFEYLLQLNGVGIDLWQRLADNARVGGRDLGRQGHEDGFDHGAR
jgi:hypothetical protein